MEPVPLNAVQIEYVGDHMILWGWAGCRFAVLQDGEVLPPGALVGLPLPHSVGILKNSGLLKPLPHEAKQRRSRL
jgi:hypothetical protein